MVHDLRGEPLVHVRLQKDAGVAVFHRVHIAVFADLRDERTGRVGQQRLHMHARRRQHPLDLRAQRVDALAGDRGDEERARSKLFEALARHGIDQIDLVEHGDDGQPVHAVDGLEDFVHRVDLPERIWVRGVHDVHHHVRFANLLERRLERLDELRGQPAHKPDRVHIGVEPAVLRARTSHGGVERGEQRVLHELIRTGEPVRQRRFARVRIPDDRNRGQRIPLARAALDLARRRHLRDLPAQACDARADDTPVHLDLRLAGTTRADATIGAGGAAARLPGQRRAPTTQAGQHVLQLRELDLRLAFARRGVLREDVEDHRGAVHDLHLRGVFERTALAGRQVVVHDDRIGVVRRHDLRDFLRLARPHIRGGIRAVPVLQHGVAYLRACRPGERGELAQGFLGLALRPVA